MNVMIVVPWDQEQGGVASVVGNLGRHLEERGHEVLFFHPGGGNTLKRRTTKWGFRGYSLTLRYFSEWYCHIRGVAAICAFAVPTIIQLLSLVAIHRIQVVNIHYPIDEFVYFGVIRWLVPIRMVCSIHGADILPAGRAKDRYSRALALILGTSDCIVAPSRSFRNEFQQIFQSHGEKTVVIPNGIRLAEFRRRNGTHGEDTRAPYVLCIAAHNEKKGIDTLLKAFAQILQQDVVLRLKLVGDGPLKKQLQSLSRELNIGDYVDFLGEMGREEVVALLYGCEILVLPSRSEPFGIVVLEAMACGKPVIASAVGGIRDIVQHMENGILIQPDDEIQLSVAVRDLLSDEALRSVLGEEGRRTVRERYGIEENTRAYEELYSRMISE